MTHAIRRFHSMHFAMGRLRFSPSMSATDRAPFRFPSSAMAASYTLYYLLYGRLWTGFYRTDNHRLGVPTELRVEDHGLYTVAQIVGRSSPSLGSGSSMRSAAFCCYFSINCIFYRFPLRVFEFAGKRKMASSPILEKRAAAAVSVVIPSANLPPPFFATTPTRVTAEFETTEQQ